MRHGGNIWEIVEKYGLDINALTDFSASINPLGIPVKARVAIKKNLNLINHYPSPDCRVLSREIAGYVGVKEENILAGNGSTELIYNIASAFLPGNVIIPVPTFSEYENSVKIHGANITFIAGKEENNFKIEVERLAKALPRGGGMVFVCNPNNPTGGIISADELKFLAKKCRQNNVILVIDEAFIDFTEDESRYSMVHNLNGSVIIIRSFTKFFAIPGLRLGYIVSNKKIIERIKKYKPSWSVNTLAQAAGVEMLKSSGYIRETKEFIRQEGRRLTGCFMKMSDKIKVYPSAANFIFAKFLKKYDSRDIYESIITRHNLIIRNCGNFKGLSSQYFRAAIKKRGENNRLIEAISELLQ